METGNPSQGRPVALVSGGSRGIGRAVVLRLARDGFDVAFCYHSQPYAAEQVAATAREAGARVLAKQADVSDAEAVRALVEAAEVELGPIAAVVSSAGVVRDCPMVSMQTEHWAEVIDVNLTGTFNLCRAAVFPMLKRRAGTVVTLSSVAGLEGNAGQANYSASKAGIVGFTRALAKEVGPYGVRVNTVAPGFIRTDMTSVLSDSQREQTHSQIPLRRWGEADEVAELVSFLVSDRAAYITASVFRIDGGISL
jgi:3-oxoacyl-[acyl-carrier protein] reductase